MTFQQLTYVVEVAKNGSINKAAKNLFLSQTALSSAIKALERELGIAIFERTARGVTVTSSGREFVGYAVSLVDQKQQIEVLYNTNSTLPPVPSSFSVSSQRFFFAQEAFLKVSENIRMKNTERYHLTFREENMNQVIEDVSNHRSNIGVISISEYNQKYIRFLMSSKNLEFHGLASVHPCVFCRVSHPLTKLSSIHEEDLLPYPYINYELDLCSASEFSEEYMLYSLRRPDKSITVTDRITADAFMSTTDAFTIGTGLLRDFPPISITSIPLETDSYIQLGLIVKKDEPLSHETSLFIKYIQDHLNRSIQHTEDEHLLNR